jgi:hypothetical protein
LPSKEKVSINEFRKMKIPINKLKLSNFNKGNAYWPLEASLTMTKAGTQPMTAHADVESAALSVWRMYLPESEKLPWAKYYSAKLSNEDKISIIKSRLDLSQCPFPIVRDVIEEAWNGKNMNLKKLIKDLKNNY